jgi:hypothetical protein
MVVLLALSLLVLGVLADHPDNTLTADDLALVADLSNAGSDFHCFLWNDADTSGLAERQTGDDAATWIEAGPLDQHTLPRPYVHAPAPRVQRETGRQDSPRVMRGPFGSGGPRSLEAIQVLGQLSDHDGLDGCGVKLGHVT